MIISSILPGTQYHVHGRHRASAAQVNTGYLVTPGVGSRDLAVMSGHAAITRQLITE